MNKKLHYLLLTALILLSTSLVGAEEDAGKKRRAFDHFDIESLLSINPFINKLPVAKVIPEKIIKPVKPTGSAGKLPSAVKPPKAVEALPSFAIKGIVWNTDRPQAIVNGKVVDVGDMVANIKILNIRKEGIDIIYNNKTLTIKP